MGFLKRLFCNAVDTAREFDEAVVYINAEPKCMLEGDNNDCSLIRKLKDKQAEKREVDSKIKSLEFREPVILHTFVSLLTKMENAGFYMGKTNSRVWYDSHGYNDDIAKEFSTSCGIGRFEHVINMMTEDEINKIHEELVFVKNRSETLSSLRAKSSSLDMEIITIKSQLGIE